MTLLEGEATGWPFFAPAEADSVTAALDLAEVGPGTRFVDLGCGDGQVLVAAARRGAEVLGVEIDESLAQQARDALLAEGLRGEVIVADLLGVDLDVQVAFAYLSPATLQRLLPRLRPKRGLRLVTVDFAVPDLVPVCERGPVHLYRMPSRMSRPRAPGWCSSGTLAVAVPDVESLTCLDARSAGGSVSLEVSSGLRRSATFQVGADEAARGRTVAVDIRWRPLPAGAVRSGTVSLPGLGEHLVVVAFGDDEEHFGTWELSTEGAAQLASVLRRRGAARPRSPAELLEAARA
jgi:SAM-dependent methyltransferase